MDECSLEEFTSTLAEHGFKLSSRGRNTYKSQQIPDRRFVIRQRVVRLERKDPKRSSHRWRLDSSYLISSQLHLARNALDNLDSCGREFQKRKIIVSMYWLIGSVAAGLALSSWAIRNLLLFINASEPAYRPTAGMILIVPALVVGILMLVAGVIWWNDSEKLRRNSLTSKAQLLGRQPVSSRDADPPHHISYQHYLYIGFSAAGPGNSPERVELRARVKKQIYRKHLTGSSITVQYAVDDPRIAILEGE